LLRMLARGLQTKVLINRTPKRTTPAAWAFGGCKVVRMHSTQSNESKSSNSAKSVIDAILGMFDQQPKFQPKSSGIDLDSIFGKRKPEFEPEDEPEPLDENLETEEPQKIKLEQLKYIHIYPRTVRRWILDTKTPKGLYDRDGIWREADYYFDIDEEEGDLPFIRHAVEIGVEKTEFIEYEHLADDLRGNYRFGVKPEEIASYSPKLKELLSLQSANKGEVMRFRKVRAVEHFGKSLQDTGSAGVQVSVMTLKIRSLTEHMKVNKQDVQSKRGLEKLVSRRKAMMRYLKRRDPETYWKVLQAFNLRDMV